MEIKGTWDYDNLNQSDAILLRNLQEEGRSILVSTEMERRWKIGQLLKRGQKSAGSSFRAWAKHAFGLSKSSAYRWIALYERYPQGVPNLGTLATTTATALLSNQSVSDETIDRIIQMAQSERMPSRKVDAIVLSSQMTRKDAIHYAVKSPEIQDTLMRHFLLDPNFEIHAIRAGDIIANEIKLIEWRWSGTGFVLVCVDGDTYTVSAMQMFPYFDHLTGNALLDAIWSALHKPDIWNTIDIRLNVARSCVRRPDLTHNVGVYLYNLLPCQVFDPKEFKVVLHSIVERLEHLERQQKRMVGRTIVIEQQTGDVQSSQNVAAERHPLIGENVYILVRQEHYGYYEIDSSTVQSVNLTERSMTMYANEITVALRDEGKTWFKRLDLARKAVLVDVRRIMHHLELVEKTHIRQLKES